MTDPAGTYRFLAWARQGLAAAIPTQATTTEGDTVVRVPVALTVARGESDTEDVSRTVRLYGPGDVVGLEPSQIIRRDPRPGTIDFEPNYFPLVEFDAPELPWLFSPRQSGDKLRPWLTLVVLRREVAQIVVDPRRPLPSLRLAAADARAELPDLTESWAWAHAQLTADAATPQQALDGRSPELTLSRLVCPRRLRAHTAYVACLVPVYRAGVQAGLRQPVVAGAELAWPPPGGWQDVTADVELPVYDHWEFATAEVGDFETLVRRLRPRPVGADIGALPVDISTAGPDFADLNLTAPTVLSFEGALTSPELPDREWPPGVQEPFAQRLEDVIDAPPGVDLTVLRPPIYGAYQAGIPDALPDTARPWLRELNLDPGWRAAAALGARVVQDNQEQLMASAWEQAGELERANGLLRQAQLARATAAAVRDKHLDGLAPDTAVRITAPVHSRVRVAPDGSQPAPGARHTLRASVKDSVFPQAAFSTPFRRATRPAGPLGRRLPGSAQQVTAELTTGLSRGRLRVPIRPPRGGADFDEVGTGPGKPRMQHLRENVPHGGGWKKIAGDDPDAGGFYLGDDPYQTPPPDPDSAEPAPGTPAHAAVLATRMASPAAELLPADDRWQIDEPGRRGDRLRGINNRFQAATEFLLQHLPATVPAQAAEGAELSLPAVAAAMVGAGGQLEPDRTVAREVVGLVAPAPPVGDPLRPRAVAPRFPQPMSRPLTALDGQMMLPGIDGIPDDSLAVLVGNPSFIEAYMAGLNHELSREMLWRGLPTDPGATFADRFWDTRGNPDQVGGPPSQLPPIESWTADLGHNAAGVGGPDMLVLMVKGRLLLRYPHTIVYAAKAVPRLDAFGAHVSGPDGQPIPTPGPLQRYPQFRGTIDPDVTYLGFDLTVDAARGGHGDLGWFFIIQEQPTAPRFGLDEPPAPAGPARGLPSSWSDLDWSHVSPAGGDVTHIGVVGPLGTTPASLPVLSGHALPTATWGADAAQMAAITYQRPMRVAIHARTALPNL
ncbi:hypothetical protein V6U81_25470 [Micromonospora sp. CPCC 205711]|uniref:hypothetical protein n=1 Tax=Micromonospora sp. CPCC 205547 TaxID=3122400 RepID=UPI002FF06BD3